MKRFILNCQGLVILIMLLMIGEVESANKWQEFNKWGISFEYPKSWKEMSAEETSKMKNFFSKELEVSKDTLANFSTIGVPDKSITVYVSKQKFQGTFTIQELVAVQKNNMDTFKKEGVVTKIWLLEQRTLSNLPAIVSDFETVDGRGYGLTMLTKDRIIIVQCIAKDFEKYKADFDHILNTLRIKLKESLYHEVSKGETLYGISRKYGISVVELQRLNKLKNKQPIYPKQKLLVIPDSQQ